MDEQPLTKDRVRWAIDVVAARAGRPREDDWELMDAAQVLAVFSARVQLGIPAMVAAMADAAVDAVREGIKKGVAEPAPEPTLLEAAERVVWGIYRNGKLADVALTRSAMEYETEYAIGYRSNTAQAMLLCKASPEQIAAVERAKGGG